MKKNITLFLTILAFFLVSTGATYYYGKSQNISNAFENETNLGNSGTAITVSYLNGKRQALTLTNNCTVTFTQPPSGTFSILLRVIQNTGSHYNITWTSVKWPSGSAPTITATDAATDLISCYLDSAAVLCVANQDLR